MNFFYRRKVRTIERAPSSRCIINNAMTRISDGEGESPFNSGGVLVVLHALLRAIYRLYGRTKTTAKNLSTAWF